MDYRTFGFFGETFHVRVRSVQAVSSGKHSDKLDFDLLHESVTECDECRSCLTSPEVFFVVVFPRHVHVLVEYRDCLNGYGLFLSHSGLKHVILVSILPSLLKKSAGTRLLPHSHVLWSISMYRVGGVLNVMTSSYYGVLVFTT